LLPNRDLSETRQPHWACILTILLTVERHLIIEELALRPSGEWKPEAHGWTVVRVAEGAGYCLQGAGARELNPGDTVISGPSAGIILRASQLGIMKLEFFLVLPQYLNGLLTVTEWRQLEDAAKHAAPHVLHFQANDPAAQKFTRIAGQRQRDCLSSRSAMLQLWASSISGLLPAHDPMGGGVHLRDRFREFIGKMSESELATRSLSELAGQLHCSERHFSRLFREEFNVSLRSRQTELRLQRARQLLAATNAKIINVAYESGYRHLGLFNQMFKRRFGLTPSAWRQKNLAPSADDFSGRGGGNPQIYLMSEGGETQRLTDGTGDATNPAWSPDGTKIAFAWTRGFEPGNFNIFIMDVVTRKLQQLTNNEGRNENPTWASDGAHIVYANKRGRDSQIWTMLADGTQKKQLTRVGSNTTPVWAPAAQ